MWCQRFFLIHIKITKFHYMMTFPFSHVQTGPLFLVVTLLSGVCGENRDKLGSAVTDWRKGGRGAENESYSWSDRVWTKTLSVLFLSLKAQVSSRTSPLGRYQLLKYTMLIIKACFYSFILLKHFSLLFWNFLFQFRLRCSIYKVEEKWESLLDYSTHNASTIECNWGCLKVLKKNTS